MRTTDRLDPNRKREVDGIRALAEKLASHGVLGPASEVLVGDDTRRLLPNLIEPEGFLDIGATLESIARGSQPRT